MADEDELFAQFLGEIKSTVVETAREGDTASDTASVGEPEDNEVASSLNTAKRRGTATEADSLPTLKKAKVTGKLVAAALPMKAGAATAATAKATAASNARSTASSRTGVNGSAMAATDGHHHKARNTGVPSSTGAAALLAGASSETSGTRARKAPPYDNRSIRNADGLSRGGPGVGTHQAQGNGALLGVQIPSGPTLGAPAGPIRNQVAHMGHGRPPGDDGMSVGPGMNMGMNMGMNISSSMLLGGNGASGGSGGFGGGYGMPPGVGLEMDPGLGMGIGMGAPAGLDPVATYPAGGGGGGGGGGYGFGAQINGASAIAEGGQEAGGGVAAENSGAKGKGKKARVQESGTKTFKRVAGGKSWQDETLADWPESEDSWRQRCESIERYLNSKDDYRLFVGDLGNEVTDEHLAGAFRKYTSFAKARVIREKWNKKSKGYGFVSFTDGMDMLKALREQNGKYLGNRPMKISKSSWKDRDAKEVKKKTKKAKKVKKALGLL